MTYGGLQDGCPYNEGVVCTTPDKCGNCGWNEEIASQRLEQILEKLGKEITKE